MSRRQALGTLAAVPIAAAASVASQSPDPAPPAWPFLPASPDHAAPILAWLAAWRTSYDELRAERLRILAELKGRLDADAWWLVGQLDDARNNLNCQEEMRMVVLLGRHFPGLEPAFWPVWQHIRDMREGEDDCCAQ